MAGSNKLLDSPWASQDTLQVKADKQTKADDMDQQYTVWKANPSPETIAPLLDGLKPTIDSGLRSYAAGQEDALRTKAKLLTVRALQTYDPKAGTRISSHVMNSLQKLYRERADRENIVHVPENVILERNRVTKAADNIESEKGRAATAEELADATGLSTGRLAKLSEYKHVEPEARFLSEKGDTLYTRTADPHKMWIDMVYAEMDPIDKKVFEWSTGYAGAQKMQKQDIAAKLKISPPAVSSRINKIIGKLEEGYGL